jgi:hypothetical protein
MSKVRVYDDAGNVIETHEHKGWFKEPENFSSRQSLAPRFSLRFSYR